MLRDNNNRAVEDGQYEMKFQIFDSETNGSSIVGEQTFTVSVKNGVYDVQLPVANALVTSTDQLWLKVTVAGETMGNRVALARVRGHLLKLGGDHGGVRPFRRRAASPAPLRPCCL